MSPRMKRVLGACAALQLAACMQGATDGVDGDEALTLAQQDAVSVDGGMKMPMVDGGMAHAMADHAHAADAGMHAHDGDMPMGDTPCTATHPRYRPGLSVKVADLTIVATSMVPAPPRQRVPNDWILQLFDASGSPVTDATIENAYSWMIAHGHGGSTRPGIIPQPTPGQFKLDNIDFKMRGPWEVLFTVTRPGAKEALVTFNICVE